MNTRILSLSIIVLAFAFSAFSVNSWTLKKDKNGVKIYTKNVEGYKLKAYKATVTVKASAEAVFNKIMDASSYPKWQHNCTGGKVVKKTSENDQYFYSIINAPWPVSDRDVVTRYQIKRAGGVITINMNAADGVFPVVDDVVRISYMKGYWKIKPLENGQVEVIQEAHAEPGGSIPDWLANSAVTDTPYNTMLNLKKMFE